MGRQTDRGRQRDAHGYIGIQGGDNDTERNKGRQRDTWGYTRTQEKIVGDIGIQRDIRI